MRLGFMIAARHAAGYRALQPRRPEAPGVRERLRPRAPGLLALQMVYG
jgi:hypothetical protein